jgi:transcriptional regulator with XRE-family HTH domain
MATISEKIFELLAERGMTQREFAQRTGISQSAISDWKRKKTNPSAEKILQI